MPANHHWLKSEFLNAVDDWLEILIPIFLVMNERVKIQCLLDFFFLCFCILLLEIGQQANCLSQIAWVNFALRQRIVYMRAIRILDRYGLCLRNTWTWKILFININVFHIFVNISFLLFYFPLCLEGTLCTDLKTITEPHLG